MRDLEHPLTAHRGPRSADGVGSATVGPITSTGSPLAGTLREVPLAAVLQTVARECGRGILQITGDLAGVICFEGGQVYLATANGGPTLRQLMVGSGVI